MTRWGVSLAASLALAWGAIVPAQELPVTDAAPVSTRSAPVLPPRVLPDHIGLERIRPVARRDAELAALKAVRPEARPPHMVRYPPVVIRGRPPVSPPPRPAFLPRTQWDFRDDGALWTRAAMAAIRAHGNGLDAFVPADIDAWCPGYRTATRAERRAFWVGLFSALAYHESTWRPEAVGGGGQWYGLLQILPSTARLYRCRATTPAALKDPVENLSCSVRIASHQVQRRGSVARGMLDWGPFHSPSKRAQMAAWTREQAYCRPHAPVLESSVRPVARPADLGR